MSVDVVVEPEDEGMDVSIEQVSDMMLFAFDHLPKRRVVVQGKD